MLVMWVTYISENTYAIRLLGDCARKGLSNNYFSHSVSKRKFYWNWFNLHTTNSNIIKNNINDVS